MMNIAGVGESADPGFFMLIVGSCAIAAPAQFNGSLDFDIRMPFRVRISNLYRRKAEYPI
jgi:hypothetical protein